MNIPQESSVLSPPLTSVGPQLSSTTHRSGLSESRASEVLRVLPRRGPVQIARAPGRLDVMGGLTAHSGGLVLLHSTNQDVCVGAEQLDGDNLLIHLLPRMLKRDPATIPIKTLNGSSACDSNGVNAEEILNVTRGTKEFVVAATVAEAVRSGLADPLDRGVMLAVHSALDDNSNAGEIAAVAAAVLVAFLRLQGKSPALEEFCSVIRTIETRWAGGCVAGADGFSALAASPDSILPIQCGSWGVLPAVPLPAGLRFIGIDSGAMAADADERFTRARVAAQMGRTLISRIVNHESNGKAGDIQLSRISVNDYVSRFRDRLPTKLQGRFFAERFLNGSDEISGIDPDFVYKIRSRTEHHVYENARAHDFVECLQRAARVDGDDPLTQAGDLMYASHWSYGQRCGLGSVATDLLVKLIRKHGEKSGIFGARISGNGCGGTVVALMSDSEKADAALEAAISEYEQKSDLPTRLFHCGSPGALHPASA